MGIGTEDWIINSVLTTALIVVALCWGVLTLAYRLKAAQDALTTAASTDGLTGLANRRLFLERGQHEFERFRRHVTAYSVLMIDIDDFKAINEKHGHAFGDRTISAVATAAAGQLRTTDLLARWGGEELVVLLPMTNAAEAIVVGEKLRLAISAAAREMGKPELTASVGGATVREDDTTLESVIARADRNLYRAKERGRNTVVSDTPEHGPKLNVVQG